MHMRTVSPNKHWNSITLFKVTVQHSLYLFNAVGKPQNIS